MDTDARVWLEENYPEIANFAAAEEEQIPDLRRFSTAWAKKNAPAWDLWEEVAADLNLLLSSDDRDDEVILDRIINFLEKPTIYRYYQIEALGDKLVRWANNYPTLSFVLFDNDTALMLAAETNHPNLDVIVERLPELNKSSWTVTHLKFGARNYPDLITVLPYNFAEWGLEIEKKLQTRDDEGREDDILPFDNLKKYRLTIPSPWDRISLAQYTKSPEAARVILGAVSDAILDESLDYTPIMSIHAFPYYERAKINPGDLSVFAFMLNDGPTIINNVRQILEGELDKDSIDLFLDSMFRFVKSLEIWKEVIALFTDPRYKQWRSVIDKGVLIHIKDIRKRPPTGLLYLIKNELKLPAKPIQLEEEETIDLIEEDRFKEYQDVGFELSPNIEESETALDDAMMRKKFVATEYLLREKTPEERLYYITEFNVEEKEKYRYISLGYIKYLLKHYNYPKEVIERALDIIPKDPTAQLLGSYLKNA